MGKLLLNQFDLLFNGSFCCLAQQKTITGVITDKTDGLPVIGATIQVKGTSSGSSYRRGWQVLNQRSTGRYSRFQVHRDEDTGGSCR